MIITLTPDQHNELDNDFWHIPFTVTIDGIEYNAHTDDDDLREIPVGVDVGIPGQNEAGDEYYISHPALDWEDEVMILAELDKRAEFTAIVSAAPQGDRAGLRQAERARLRTEARQDARKAARVAQRRADRRAARRAAREALRDDYAAELDAARPPEEGP